MEVYSLIQETSISKNIHKYAIKKSVNLNILFRQYQFFSHSQNGILKVKRILCFTTSVLYLTKKNEHILENIFKNIRLEKYSIVVNSFLNIFHITEFKMSSSVYPSM